MLVHEQEVTAVLVATRWRWHSLLIVRTVAAYSLRPYIEPLDTRLMATSRPSSLRKPRYTEPNPPCPSLRSSVKFLVAAANWPYRNLLGSLSTMNSSASSSYSHPIMTHTGLPFPPCDRQWRRAPGAIGTVAPESHFTVETDLTIVATGNLDINGP
jgi:hypothetical protein